MSARPQQRPSSRLKAQGQERKIFFARTQVSSRSPGRQELDVQLLALLHEVGEELTRGGLWVETRRPVSELPKVPRSH